MKTETRLVNSMRWLAAPGLMVAVFFASCTPEGVINKTKYNGEKVINTCETFTEEVQQIINSNSNPSQLAVAEYDNTDFDGYHLDVGQYEIKDGMLNCRLASDLEYEKYCKKGVAVHVTASYSALNHLSGMESPASGDAGMLVVNESYVTNHKDPYFMYEIPLTNDKDLNGKQLSLKYSVVKYDKKGNIKKVFCNSQEVPLGPVSGGCCTYLPWENAAPLSSVEMPDVKIADETYRYRGFTGTLDIIFPINSSKYDKKVLVEAITNYINKYQSAGFKVTSINLEGWASLGGKEDANQTLSDKRAKAVYDDLRSEMKDSTLKIDYAGKGEDWERFKLLTKTSALSAEEQQATLAIANDGAANDEKEKQMRALSFWQKLVDEVIVNTRHTFVTFKFDYAPDKMYVEYYPSQMPVISDELYNVATKTMTVAKWKQGEDVKKNMKVLDILIGNNKKANLFAMRSTYHFASNDFRKAIEDIDQAMSLNAGNQQYSMASLAYKTKYASNYSLEERMAMLDMYNDQVSKNPGNAGLLFNRAVMMDKVGFLSGALVEYDQLLAGKDPSAANLNNRGVAKLKTMRLTEAEADFKAALEKNPSMAEANFNLAVLYAYKGLTNKVIENLDQAVVKDPSTKGLIWSNAAFAIMREGAKFDKYR